MQYPRRSPIASSIMGFEDEAEQSLGRPCRKKNGRTKRTHELTSSIVPRGTSFHCSVEPKFSPIGFDPERFSCCCRGLLPRPPELSAVNPDAVHDHGQPASQGHDRLFHPAALSDLHGPRLEPAPFFLNASCSELLRRALTASSHRHSAIFHRSNRPRPIDIWSTSAQTPPRLTWISGTGQAHRRWRDRSATPRGRHPGSSSNVGKPHRLARWPANGDAG